MPRKSTLLLSLLNMVVKPITGQLEASSNQLVVLPQHPPAHDRGAWRAYWNAQGQSWRTEPEIDEKRQEYLAQRRMITPDIEHGIYPFKDIKLNRADVEWLLATHEDGQGPVIWSDESQRRRNGLDLRGADLRGEDLSPLPLAKIRGGLRFDEWEKATPEQREWASIHLESCNLFWTHLNHAKLRRAHLDGTDLRWARLEGADLREAHLEDADLFRAHLERTHLIDAHLERVNLREAHLEKARLENIVLSDEKHTGPYLVDVQLGETNLAVVKWSQVEILSDEYRARERKCDGKAKDKATRLDEHETAVRANRQLAVALQAQGLNEDAARFAYRAQVLQKRVFWFQMLQKGAKPRQRAQVLGAWLFSWFLFLLAGYGYRVWRSFLAYVLVIVGFTMLYYILGASFKPSLSVVNALGLSMTSFHGRGFFPGVTQLNDPLTILASLEAFVGLILEATFIAALTQRFFGK
jgi:uncharacterized protein YjbI with pentapeptide repeats